MGKRKGTWRKFFCCAGPPETQSSTHINISGSDHAKPLLEPELEQEDEDLYIEAEMQTSNVEIPEGNRWRWSRLHHEVEVQTSLATLPVEEVESDTERDAQMQTSFLSLPREVEAEAQTSFLPLQSPAPFETEARVRASLTKLLRESSVEAQVQTSLFSLPGEREAQVQTSLFSLPGEREAQVQTSLFSLPGEREAQVQTSLFSLPGEREAQVQTSFLPFPERQSVISIQVPSSYIEVLEKIASLPMLAEAQVQTSNLEMSPSETDVQIQTSFSDYISEKEETSSIETEQQSNKSPQYSEMDYNTLYPVYISAEAQTLPVEIPPGNDWRSARLKAAAQVQTSNILLEKPVQLSKVKLEKSEMLVEELGPPLAMTEKFCPSQLTEIGTQMSGAEILEEEKRSLSQHSSVQVQPITLELLKKLSLLSQIEMLESTSRTELLKKVSSLSVTEPHVQTPSYELQRKPSCLSDSATQGQVLNVELLKKRLSSAPVVASSDYEPAGKLQLPFPAKDVQAPTSDLELTKKLLSSSHIESQGRASDADLRKYSSLSLIEAMDGNQEEITEGREYLITPQLLEAQIRKWYHEFPEMQTASQAPVQREPLLSPTVDSEVQTSSIETPEGNRWRASRLQADAEMQTSGFESSVEEVKSGHQLSNKMMSQTSLLELWQARDLTDAQIETSGLGLARTKVESPPPLVIDSHVQTSLFNIWKASTKADAQTQTSVTELPKQAPESPRIQHIDRPAQTSFLEISKAKKADSVQQKACAFPEPKEGDSPLQTDQEVQTSCPDVRKGKEKTDVLVQTSLLGIPNAQEEPLRSMQTDAVMQTSDVEIPVGSRWRASRLHADAQLQTSMLDMKEAELESPPLSHMDTQVQTSLLDVWKTKDPRDAWAQTSRMEMSKSLEEPRPPTQLENVVQSSTTETAEPSPPFQTNTEVQTSLLDLWKTKDPRDVWAQTSTMEMSKSLEEPHPPAQPENVVQSSTSETAEASPPFQTNTEVQTSLLDLRKTKDPRDVWAQTSSMEMSKSLEEPHPPTQPENVVQSSISETAEASPPFQTNTEVQTSLLDLWKMKDPRDVWAQTSMMDMPKSLEEPHPPTQPENVVQSSISETAEASPPFQTNTEVQTSLLDLWKMKDPRDVWAQTSMMDMPKSLEEPHPHTQPENVVQSSTSETAEASPPFQTNTEVQTSLLDLWKTKDPRNSWTQTSRMDMPKSLEEPCPTAQPEDVVQSSASETAESSPPFQTNTEVQTSLLDLWKTKDPRNSWTQTSRMDMPKSLEEPRPTAQPENVMQSSLAETAEPSPPFKINTEVQTSLLDLRKTKDPRNSWTQTFRMDMPKSLEEPRPTAQPENVVQSSASETAESSPPSQINNEVQTSLLDIWKAKEVSSSLTQTSQMDALTSVEESSLPLQPENVVQSPTFEIVESSPPSQIDTEVQTSFLDIWKTKALSNSLAQTSQMDLSTSVEESPFPSQPENVAQLPTVETAKSPLPFQADTEAQTSFFDIWKAKELSNVQMQTSWMDLPKSMEKPLLQPQSEGPVQTATPESPPPTQIKPEKQISLLEMWKARESVESSEIASSSPSSADIQVQDAQLDLQTPEEPPCPPVPSCKSDLANAILQLSVPSRTASPVPLSTPANVEAALLAQTDPQLPTSLLEIWTSRQEAEVQMQTDNFGLSFDKNSPLFPVILESQEKLEQICQVEGMSEPPIFTEAQVQTSFVEIPRGKKWRSSRLCTEAQVQTSFPDLRSKDRVPALQKMVSDHVSAKRVPKGPKRATPVSVHLHVKMSPKRRTSCENKYSIFTDVVKK